MNYQEYLELQHKIVPGLRFNQEIYADTLDALVKQDDVWLDAGCGRRILHQWSPVQRERELVERARLVTGCDIDLNGIRQHRSLSRVAVADLGMLPYASESFSLITCNVVIEHLRQPARVFNEFARVLRPGGRLLVHTPNATSHFVLVSRILPRRAKLRLDGRAADEIFPTEYRANTCRTLGRLMKDAGLTEQSFEYLSSVASLQNFWVLASLELLWIRLTRLAPLRRFQVSILAIYRKDGC